MKSPDLSGFVIPDAWPYDGCERREPVIDADARPEPRTVRLVGWRHCMACAAPFWSEDVSRLRICDDCKAQ